MPEDDLQARLKALNAELKAAKPAPLPTRAPANPMGIAMQAGSEFVSAIVVGGAIGFGVDWVFHTKPAFTILFFLLGVVAGTLGVIRATSPKGGKPTL